MKRSATSSEVSLHAAWTVEDIERRVHEAKRRGQVEVHLALDSVELLLTLVQPAARVMRERAFEAARAAAAKILAANPSAARALEAESWPFTEARHGNRRTALRLRPLVKLGLVEVKTHPTSRTWMLTIIGAEAFELVRARQLDGTT